MNIYLDMVGCKLNQAEIEQMARQFRTNGHTIVASASDAELVVINTCSVTSEAASDSRQKIRHAIREGALQVVATGCWSTLQPQQAAGLAQHVTVIANDKKATLVNQLLRWDTGSNFQNSEEVDGNSGINSFELEPISRSPIPGLRQRTRAFVKVQDGCNNSCTFCITTIARGNGQSVPVELIIQDINAAVDGGAKEIVLTGVHMGSWGQEFGKHLSDLIKIILSETDMPRLRLSSVEPWDLDENFFSLWENGRLCPHLHLPLQSGSTVTLKRMLRKTTPESFKSLLLSARTYIPNIAITTDLIAGFPGETEYEFNETLEFVKQMNFAGGHVFSYSPRPGTPAARIREQIPQQTRKARNHNLQEVLTQSGTRYREGFIGQTLPVLWEASAIRLEKGWLIEGLTANYIRVKTIATELRWNQIDLVDLLELTTDGLNGEIK